MKISVTQDNIQTGERCSRRDCAISKAMKQLGFDFCSTGYKKIIFGKTKEDKFYSFDFPKEITDIINKIDLGQQTESFEFEMDEKKIKKLTFKEENV